ncbi:phosphotransferase [Sphaerisporangium fuscum]|uniref:phosphotransferase n=1 Tax=Sphaerisporangium fuscum TaxID=2835868 RepID=UPI001BDC5C7E|nr:phosphotransferase [Sphaerisporangium fuscum]
MNDLPEGLGESELRDGLAAWGVADARLEYAPVGFGDYHWTAAGDGDRRWFVTVADLAHKTHCGVGAEAAFDGLRRAMDTAAALRDEAGLDFVVAPLPDAGGETLRRLGERYAVSVFPFVDGVAGDFGRALTPAERAPIIDLLAELHRAKPPSHAPLLRPELSTRAHLEQGLGELDRPWEGGPYAGPARALLAEHAPGLRRRLEEFDRRVAELDGKAGEPVLTHGEPHPGNLLRLGERLLLVDWDTVGVAEPERDLWQVAEDAGDLARYADATGQAPDPSALTLHRLRWDLEDLGVYVGQFRAPHGRTTDTEQAWGFYGGLLRQLTGDAEYGPLGMSG